MLTTTLRGDVACVVTVKTLEHPLHSGVFGGPVPDAMMALARLLATLHDDQGNVAVDGVTSFDWDGMDFGEEDLRAGADMLDGAEVVGSGSVGRACGPTRRSRRSGSTRPRSTGPRTCCCRPPRPSSRCGSSPAPTPRRSSTRSSGTSRPTRPGARPSRSSARRRRRRSGARRVGPGTPPRVSRCKRPTARRRGEAGSGGSIPLLRTLQQAAPGAEFILWGPEDVAKSRIHASDESVDPAEIEKMIVAQIRLLEHLADKD